MIITRLLDMVGLYSAEERLLRPYLHRQTALAQTYASAAVLSMCIRLQVVLVWLRDLLQQRFHLLPPGATRLWGAIAAPYAIG
jgi:hypothetical protein